MADTKSESGDYTRYVSFNHALHPEPPITSLNHMCLLHLHTYTDPRLYLPRITVLTTTLIATVTLVSMRRC